MKAQTARSALPPGSPQQKAAEGADPDKEDPVFFAKSPRSCIIDPGEAYLIPPGRTRIDWEGELAIVIGKPSYMIGKEKAHDAVFVGSLDGKGETLVPTAAAMELTPINCRRLMALFKFCLGTGRRAMDFGDFIQSGDVQAG